METLIELSRYGVLSQKEITISLTKLVRFLVVYPELLRQSSVTLGDLAEILLDVDPNAQYIITTKTLNKVFLATRYWFRHIIETSLRVGRGATRVSVNVDIAVNHTIRTIECDEFDVCFIIDMSDLRLIEALSRDLLVQVSSVDDPDLLYNIAMARKVALEC